MKKVTNIKEYNEQGVLVKETTITEEDAKTEFVPFIQPVSPPNYHWINPVIYKNPNKNPFDPYRITCQQSE